MTKFKYNNRIYNPSNLDKKLKKLGITRSDIEIIEDTTIKDNDNGNNGRFGMFMLKKHYKL